MSKSIARLVAPTLTLVLALVLVASCSGETPEPMEAEPSCGNARIDPGEVCDVGIGSGSGACPSRPLDCDDADPCTTDKVDGTGCATSCVHEPVTVLAGGDMCCPMGASPLTDPDCGNTLCGNGVLEPGELCDPAIGAGVGACPTDCTDGDTCTTDRLAGDRCDIQCHNDPITTFVGGDRCCPPGADGTTDPDCNAVCGNGVLEPGEVCDPAITTGAGRCVTAVDCNDGIACTADLVALEGGDLCSAFCTNTEITTAGPVDGCCPVGASPGADPDCAGCGDGVVGPNETCDTAIATGPNACPTEASCGDNDACTVDGIVGAGTCTAACTHAPNQTLTSGDGCCLVPNTFPSLDTDCPTLGNGLTCNVGLDCQTGRCEFFELGNASMCTAGCSPQAVSVASNCSAGADASWIPVCLSAAEASNGGAQNVCVYFIAGATGFADLQPNASYMWNFTNPAQVHAYALPSYADGIDRRWEITLTPVGATLDVAARNFDPALLPTNVTCDAGTAGAAETCVVQVAATDASERFWFVAWPQAGLGDYHISLALLP